MSLKSKRTKSARVFLGNQNLSAVTRAVQEFIYTIRREMYLEGQREQREIVARAMAETNTATA